MTIKDVAAYCGVAVSTVSRVLNNHPDVSPETRTRVLEAVDKLHYIPNNSARDLVLAPADTIGLVVRGAENPFFTPIIRTIEERCEKAGYTMVLHQIPVGADEISAGATLVRSKRLKGLIFLGGRFDYSRAEGDAIGIPFVCCTNTNQFGDLDKSVYSSVSIDDYAEGYKATKLLIDHGHTKIAVLLDSVRDHSISELRYAGYRQALVDAGVPLDEDLVLETVDFTMSAAYAEEHRNNEHPFFSSYTRSPRMRYAGYRIILVCPQSKEPFFRRIIPNQQKAYYSKQHYENCFRDE